MLKPGGRALIASIPKETCGVTQDVEWDCPRCFWKLPAVDKEFWHRCFSAKAGCMLTMPMPPPLSPCHPPLANPLISHLVVT